MSTAVRSLVGSPSTIQSASARPAPPPDAMPTELNPAPTKKPREPGRLAQDELIVGREALRAVEQLLETGLLQHGDPMDGGLHQHTEVIPVLLQELELERIGQRIRGDPRLGLRLEAPHDEAADLLLDVGVAVGVAQDGQVRADTRNGFGHHVEVLGRVEGDVDPAQEADRLRPLTGAVHDDLGLNGSPVRDHARDPTVAGDDVRDARALRDAHAPHAGAAGQRRRHVDRIDRAVAGQPEGAEQIADLQNGVALPSLRRRQQFALEVVGLCGGRRTPELDQTFRRPGHRHPAAPLEAGGQTGLGLELAVEAGRILHQAGPGLGRPELAEEARRVPRRAATRAAPAPGGRRRSTRGGPGGRRSRSR